MIRTLNAKMVFFVDAITVGPNSFGRGLIAACVSLFGRRHLRLTMLDALRKTKFPTQRSMMLLMLAKGLLAVRQFMISDAMRELFTLVRHPLC